MAEMTESPWPSEAYVYRDREKKDRLLMSLSVKGADEASMALLLFFVSLLWLLAYSFTTAFYF